MTDKLKDFEEDVKSLVKQYWGDGNFMIRDVSDNKLWIDLQITIKRSATK